MNKKNTFWVWIVAGITALAGIAVAIAVFVKRAGKKLQKDLEFDDSIYFEDEDSDDEIPEDDEVSSEDEEAEEDKEE